MDKKYLRKKIVELLKAAKLKEIGNQVFSQRSIPTNIDTLPVALVYTSAENSRRFDESPKRYMKELDVTIELITSHDDDAQLADEMDDLSMAIEAAMEADLDLERCVEFINHTSSLVSTESDGQSPVGSVKINFSIGYIFEPDRDYILPDMTTISNNWEVNGNEDQAKDTICYPGE